MLALPLIALALALSPVGSDSAAFDRVAVTLPRECPDCGEYRGPNLSRVYDPYLRQVDIWPDFVAASCQFEVASFTFVTLSRSACANERAYREAMPRSRGAG